MIAQREGHLPGRGGFLRLEGFCFGRLAHLGGDEVQDPATQHPELAGVVVLRQDQQVVTGPGLQPNRGLRVCRQLPR